MNSSGTLIKINRYRLTVLKDNFVKQRFGRSNGENGLPLKTMYPKYNERKKTRLNFFAKLQSFFSLPPFFARKSFLAQLNALFKNIRKQKTQNPLYKSFGLKRCGSRSFFFLGKWVSLKRYDHFSGIVYPNNKRSNLASILIKHHPALNLSSS